MRGQSGLKWVLGALVLGLGLGVAPAGCGAILGLDDFSESGATSTSSTGSTGTGGEPATTSSTGGAACSAPTECPQPPAGSHATATCIKGACDFACDSGRTNCDGDFATNGCEVDLETDPAHCGACSNACSVPSCSKHVCNNPIGVAAGIYHTCAVLHDQSVWCWGKNGNGELGDGTNITRPQPVVILPPGSAMKVVTGGDTVSPFTCVLTTSNEVKCWGGNAYGQLGINSTQDKNTPQLVALQGVTDIEVGGGHTCAIKNPGALHCWGFNDSGQLGNGTKTNTFAPPSTATTTGVTQVGLGGAHTCAVRPGTQQQCWGNNGMGQVGDSSPGYKLSPATLSIAGGNALSEFALGASHTCARADAALYCFGRNYSGEAGTGDTSTGTYEVPQLLALADVKSISMARNQWSGAVAGANDTVYTWGLEEDECLGNGPGGDPAVYVPTKIALMDVARLSLGYRHACALKKSGELVCWGNNVFGEVGDGTLSPTRSAPTAVVW